MFAEATALSLHPEFAVQKQDFPEQPNLECNLDIDMQILHAAESHSFFSG